MFEGYKDTGAMHMPAMRKQGFIAPVAQTSLMNTSRTSPSNLSHQEPIDIDLHSINTQLEAAVKKSSCLMWELGDGTISSTIGHRRAARRFIRKQLW